MDGAAAPLLFFPFRFRERLSVTVLLYNALHLLSDGALLLWLRGRRGWLATLGAAVASGLVSLVLAYGLAKLSGWHLFGILGLFAWGVFGHTLLVLAGAALVHRRTHVRTALAAGLAAVTLGLIAIDAFLIEPRWLEVSRHRIESPKLSQPVRIVVLADIQTDDPGAYERRVLTAAMAEQPDLILLPGDYLHVDTDEQFDAGAVELRGILQEVGLAAPLGVYAVGGNTDPERWPKIFDGLDVTCFEDSGNVRAGELSITGLRLGHSFRRSHRIAASPEFHLVFGHGPDFSLGDVDADLLIAGHCHGGQVRLPFFGPPIKLAWIPRAWTSGLHEIRPGTWLSVSRGIGLERLRAPRLRFLCRPEVVVIDLVPAAQS